MTSGLGFKQSKEHCFVARRRFLNTQNISLLIKTFRLGSMKSFFELQYGN